MAYIGKRPQDTFPSNNSVTATIISANAVGSSEIAGNAVGTGEIAANSVTAAKIPDNTITATHIPNDLIDSDHLAAGGIDTEHLSADAVTAAKLADDAVVTANIVDLNVTTGKIANNAITAAKLPDNVITATHIPNGLIVTAHIADNAVTAAKIPDNVLTATMLPDNVITATHLPDNVILATHIPNATDLTLGTVTAALTGNVTGNVSGSSGSTTGLAATATALATARTIGGTSFDGTANIVPGTATEATNVTVSANNSTDETVYPVFVDGATGTQGAETDTGLTYNPSTGVLTTTSVTGNLTGNVTGNASGTAATVTGGTQASITSAANLVTVGTIGTGVWQGTAVATAYIADNAITAAKLPDNVITATHIPNDLIDSDHYAAASIDNEHLADDAVDSDELAAGAVDLAHMSVNSIDSDQYVDGSIDLAHMSANSVDSDQYVDGSIDTAHIADDQVTAAKLANTAVTAASYGSSSAIPVITVDAQGRITGASTASTSSTLTIAADSGSNDTVTVGSDTLTFAGTSNEVNTTVSNNQIQIGLPDDVTIAGDLIVTGDYTVNGTTSTNSVTNMVIADNLIELNNGAGSNANDSGIVIERGSTGDNAIIAWDESADKFIVGTTTATGASTGNLTITTGTLVANVEGNVTGNVTGNTSGTAATVTTAAQTNITSLGTLTALTVDNLGINGNTITANSGALNLTPAGGSAIVLDGTISVDAGVVTGATSVTSTAFVGALTGDVTGNVSGSAGSATGNAATATALATARTIGGTSFDGTGNIAVATATEATNITASANNSTDETVYPAFVDGATGTQGIETDTGLTYNPSSGILTATQFTGAVVGNVTGNASGTAATVTGGTQASITSAANLVTVGTIGTGVWQGTAIASGYIAADAITGAKIADDAIDSEHYTDGSIDTAHIADNAVTAAKIPDNVLTATMLPDNVITATHLPDNIIAATHLPDNVLTATHIPNGVIATAHLAADAVDGTKIADDAINSEHYAAASIDNEHLADDAVGADELAANAVVTASIVAGSVTVTELADNSVTSAKIVNGTIVTADIANNAILTQHIDDNQITGDQIADDLVLSGTGAIRMPDGTTAQRPSAAAGMFRYNTTTSKFEGYTDSWGDIGGGGSNTFTRDAFTGDGSDTTFTLSQSGVSENNLLVFIEGVFQDQDAYSVSGTTLTFGTAPVNGRGIIAYSVASAVSGSNLNQTSASGDGSTTQFTMGTAPVDENNTQVFIDGVYQHKNTYSTSGTTLTFSAAPPNGTAIEIMIFTQTDINTPTDDTVDTAHLKADAVTGAKIADDAIDSEHYTDGSIDTAHIADNAVTAAKIPDNVLTATMLPDNVILATHIPDGLIATAHIADNAVTAAKIPDNVLTATMLPDNVILATHIPNATAPTFANTTVTGTLDVTGNVLKGHASSITQEVCQSGTTVSSWTPDIQINGASNGGLSVSQWNTGDTASANLWLTKSGNGTKGTHGGLNANEAIGRIIFSASDGSTFSNAASIEAFADGGQGSNDTPGRLVFKTTADGATTPTERMRIDDAGKVGIGVTPASGMLHLHAPADDNAYLHITQGDGGATSSDGMSIGMLDGGANAAIRLRENGFMQIYTNNTERMRIVAGGAVGIGTDTPTAGLTVATSANITQVALTSSSNAVAWDADAAGNAYYVTTENTTFGIPSNATEGQIISVEIAQGGTAYTVAWNTVFEFAASTAPTMTATANKTDIYTFRYNGTNANNGVWQEIGRVQNMAQT